MDNPAPFCVFSRDGHSYVLYVKVTFNFFTPVQKVPVFFPGNKVAWVMMPTTFIHLSPRLRMS